MSFILSTSTANPPYVMDQNETMVFARDFFKKDFQDIDRLLQVFLNGSIEQRYFSKPISWFKEKRTFTEKNDVYCNVARDLSMRTIKKCLANEGFLKRDIQTKEIDAIIFVSTTGLATPSLEVSLINQLDFDSHTKRLPIWGLGCAGGTAGLARADDFCTAHPEAAVLVVSVELCSLTFQYNDRSKSNLIGVSLFADGAACALVVGEASPLLKASKKQALPKMKGSESTLLKDSEEVMGWNIRDEGLYVVFSKSIPALVERWFKPVTENFLKKFGIKASQLTHFIAHPGGRKVLEAYEETLSLNRALLEDAWDILKHYGNMSSPTVLFVLDRVMRKDNRAGEKGLAASLGPGFSAELLMMEWEVCS
ncbi:alkylresorcinol/alkylpyrone synthase [Pullulanibacillus pueri]|uniref:Putative chalcone synthase n=1 Tax=Pullulanibacillus pueri TaxID=1437324 RepID=A0A8J2ZZL9_9BACL|nr:3-oxoacyl-[acyl-carrier-protein] synthase III C-terminal domain-containing protein [Pullulanibacillus pueri]MBM7683807.1 alkylresorcinol/alkylpyrone synthase [Pullulanibacillus pueri]GGH87655.1 putative chalcone synthase [Pullulanibacillus pueri]